MNEFLQDHHGIKIWLSVQMNYMHTINGNRPDVKFPTRSQVIYNSFELDEILDEKERELHLRNAHFLRQGSGLIISSIHNAVIHAGGLTSSLVGATKTYRIT